MNSNTTKRTDFTKGGIFLKYKLLKLFNTNLFNINSYIIQLYNYIIDRGDRVGYESPYEGARLTNLQRNVMKCLSKIKGYTVSEDFPFRTEPNPNLES